MIDLPIHAPRYLGRFRCLGSACEDICCSGDYWTGVPVDPTTVAAYRQLTASGDRRALQLNLGGPLRPDPRPDPDEVSPSAFMVLERGATCQFLSAERGCTIHEAFGEALLPSVCDTFPRKATQVDGRITLAGSLACPEITRLVLFDEDALTIETVTADRRMAERGRSWIERPWPDRPGDDERCRQYHRIRGRSVTLLQRRDYSLGARMLALGAAVGALDSTGSRTADVETAFDLGERHLPSMAVWLAEGGEGTSDGPGRPHRVLLRRIQRWIATPAVSARHRRHQERIRTGLGLPDDPTTRLTGSLGERVAASYADACQRYLEPYLSERPYLLENLTVHRLGFSMFPFHRLRTFAEQHALLAVAIGLIRLQLVGVAAAEGGLTDELVVETVQAFHKYPMHPRFWEWTLKMLHADRALDRPSSVAMLLA